jgi:hypothetical protein
MKQFDSEDGWQLGPNAQERRMSNGNVPPWEAKQEKDPWDLDEESLSAPEPEAMKGRLATIADIQAFMIAGNAVVTFKSLKTGTHFTYKISPAPDQATGEPRKDFFFVGVLSGSDNTSDYKYLGFFNTTQMVYRHGTAKSKIAADASSAKAFAWVFNQVFIRREMPDDVLEVWHEGKCGRCGRRLTVPESIASGFGPECRGRP